MVENHDPDQDGRKKKQPEILKFERVPFQQRQTKNEGTQDQDDEFRRQNMKPGMEPTINGEPQ